MGHCNSGTGMGSMAEGRREVGVEEDQAPLHVPKPFGDEDPDAVEEAVREP